MSNVANPNYELGLLYVSGILKEDDLLILRSNLKKNGIELKSFDKNGNITASIEDFTNVYSFLINSSLLAGLVSGVIASAAWESIRYVILHTFKKVKDKKYNKITSKGIEEKEATLGIEVKVNNNHYNFRFNGISSEKAFHEALDKIIPLLVSVQSQTIETHEKSIPEIPTFIGTYDEKTCLWVVRETSEIIKEKIRISND
ncbi:hypothetical protein MKX36_12165 [Paenibacillus sp. FSL W8-0439]|uniref:hypothetical protein n=1 Tax=Paenibacillus TaxID=44249 RepID=UPI000C9F5510|nr:hypothetical protein [Paenibacillus polymyxa]AUS26757.1 hypothetical protein C1A50_2590 [Paenibacillus polymyxa]